MGIYFSCAIKIKEMSFDAYASRHPKIPNFELRSNKNFFSKFQLLDFCKPYFSIIFSLGFKHAIYGKQGTGTALLPYITHQAHKKNLGKVSSGTDSGLNPSFLE